MSGKELLALLSSILYLFVFICYKLFIYLFINLSMYAFIHSRMFICIYYTINTVLLLLKCHSMKGGNNDYLIHFQSTVLG